MVACQGIRIRILPLFPLFFLLFAAISLPAATDGQEGPGDDEARDSDIVERVKVVSKPPARTPGSITVLTAEDLERQVYDDIHRILRAVPGLNLQEEDGYGLRPNIGIRGTGSERSQKITLLEDGVLVAPAPYAAPAAYYFPSAGRMDGVEIRKGSSSIRQGPQTNGGVLNLLSAGIPDGFGGRLQVATGSDATERISARLGDSGKRLGWLFETYQFETDGFKRLDGGGPTGVDLDDYLFKLRYTSDPGARRFQSVELKVGRTEQFGNETYLGLTDADFAATPFRRYAASQRDTITTEHDQIQVRHLVRLNDATDLTTTVYRNEFFRNWAKLQSVDGAALGNVLDDPTAYAAELAILRGEADSADDALSLRNNRRDYYSQGIQAAIAVRPTGRLADHAFEFGLRLHRDEEDRFQEEDGYRMLGGQMVLTSRGAPGSQSNRVSAARAISAYVEDEISLGRWTVTPGVRFENVDFTREDYGSADPGRTGAALQVRRTSYSEWIPGVGVNYRLSERAHLFGGVHRGYAPPGPGSSQQADPEESRQYEAGYRLETERDALQVTGFYIDYENLLGADTLSSGGGGSLDLFNGGAVDVVGLEASYSTEFGRARVSGVRFPLSLSATLTDAEFRSSFESDFAGWGDRVTVGDELPYLPEQQVAARFGIVHPRWSLRGDVSWVAETRSLPGQGPIPASESIDAHVLADVLLEVGVRRGVRAFAQARNLTDEVYVAARRPAGLRPGIGRTVLLGVKWDF